MLSNFYSKNYYLKLFILRLYFFAMIPNRENKDVPEITLLIDELRKKNYKILVIDDDDRFRKSLCFKLKRKFNALVDDVDSGLLGIDKLKAENRYDLILTDIMMPGKTGIETYYEIRKIDPRIKIGIMSAYSSSEEWKKAQAIKDITLLHKPFSDEDLIEVLTTR